MDQNSTLNTLIQLSYSELSDSERVKAISEIQNSEDLQDQLGQILEMKALLDQEMHTPNPTSIQIILEESQKNELETY